MMRNIATIVTFGGVLAVASCRAGYETMPLGAGPTGGVGFAGSSQAQGGASVGGAGGEGATAGAGNAAAVGGAPSSGAGNVTEGGAAGEAATGGGPFGGAANEGGTLPSGGVAGGGGIAGTASGNAGSGDVAGASASAGSGGLAPGCSLSGSTYAVCEVGATYDDASTACASMGMRLVRIDSSEENDWVASAVVDPWIGASDGLVEGEWRWSDGTLFWLGTSTGSAQNGLYNAWQTLNPSGVPPASDCAKMTSASRTWNDVLCFAVTPFVCEAY